MGFGVRIVVPEYAMMNSCGGGVGLGQRVHSLGGGVAPLVVLEYATLNTCGEGLGLVHNSRGGV